MKRRLEDCGKDRIGSKEEDNEDRRNTVEQGDRSESNWYTYMAFGGRENEPHLIEMKGFVLNTKILLAFQ